jgi:hypothetical protein
MNTRITVYWVEASSDKGNLGAATQPDIKTLLCTEGLELKMNKTRIETKIGNRKLPLIIRTCDVETFYNSLHSACNSYGEWSHTLGSEEPGGLGNDNAISI